MPAGDGRRGRQPSRLQTWVIDANVTAKWFLSEADSDLAVALLKGGDRLIAPSLIRTETIGAILRACRRDVMREEDAREAIARWERVLDDELVSIVPTDELVAQAIDVALALGHPLHDCLYVALAVSRKARLVTADGPLHKRSAESMPVDLLSDRRVGRA
jgi:predicted nucleic acid-binding protein